MASFIGGCSKLEAGEYLLHLARRESSYNRGDPFVVRLMSEPGIVKKISLQEWRF